MTFALVLTAMLAWAHGPVADQAAYAVKKATELFLKEKDAAEFRAVRAENVGEEKFKVEFMLKSGRLASYACGLNENVKPVKWGCEKVSTP